MKESREERIRRGLGGAWPELQIQAAGTVDSTNLRLKEAARTGSAAPPFLLTAESQTAGRGRLGRVFVSPPDTGLYMSLLFSPPDIAATGAITLSAAVAVCRAIEECTALRPKIKWVNDLFLSGKKVCGILAEAVGRDVIVGIGVNLKTPPGGFPPEAGAAGALDADVDACYLAGRIAAHFLECQRAGAFPGVLADYRARMPLIGHTVRYTQQGQEKSARVTGVDDQGGLMIEGPEGPGILRCGEISLGSQGFSGDDAFE